MTKLQFLFALKEKLAALPPDEVEERLNFYAEMIEDRMEEGLSEEEAVAAVSSAGDFAADAPTAQNVAPKRRLKPWELLLLVLGSPVWLALLIAAAAVVFSLYACLWAVIISLWAVFGSVAGCGIGGAVAGIAVLCSGNLPAGIALLGAGIFCAGLAILLFFSCKAVTHGTLLLTVRCFRRFFKKEETK